MKNELKEISLNSMDEFNGVMKILGGKSINEEKYHFGVFHIHGDSFDFYIKGVYKRNGQRQFFGCAYETKEDCTDRKNMYNPGNLILVKQEAHIEQLIASPESFVFENQIRGEFLKLAKGEPVKVKVCI